MDFAAIEQRAQRAASGQNITMLASTIVRLLACVFWVRVYWVYIQPNWAIANVGMAIDFLIDTGLVLAFGIAFALVPPVFIASLVPSTPANMLLSKIQAKYSWPGFIFGAAGGVWLTFESYVVVYSWWASRPVIVEAGMVRNQALITIFLTIGFTAWSLTRVTPEQWVDLMVQAREVMRLDRELQMEEAALKATHVRAVALIEMDVTQLTAAQLTTRNRELTAIFSALERTREQRFASMARTWRSLHGIDVATRGEPSEVITARWKQVHHLLNDTARGYGENADYVAELAEAPAPALAAPAVATVRTESGRYPTATLVPLQNAETGDRDRARATAPVDRHGPPRPATAGDRATADEAYQAARAALSGAWSRANLEAALSIQKTKANDLIRIWRQQGLILDVTNPAHHYTFVEA